MDSDSKRLSDFDVGEKAIITLVEGPAMHTSMGKGGKGLSKEKREKEVCEEDEDDDESPAKVPRTETDSTTSVLDPSKKDALLSSFASGSSSSNVEVVFSFDTTGSMSSTYSIQTC